MNIYLLDRNLRVCDTLSNEGDAKSSPFFNDEYIQYLETGAETFEFETLESDYLENGNYVAFSYKNDYKLFQISEIEDTHEDNLIKKVYCEVAGLELTYEIMRPRTIASANIKQFMSTVLSDTSWEVGYIDENITDTYTIEIDDYEKIYDLIQEYIKKYQCEISFRVTMKNATVTHKYIDVFKRRGSITDYRFEYSKNVNGITRKVNSFDLCTAIIGTGKDGQTFKDAEWLISNGNPADKPLNQDFLVDEMAFKLYNNNGSHLMGYFKCDLESPYDILAATYKELQERKQPKVEYEVNISLFDIDDVELGDEVYVIDNEWKPEPLLLSARVNELHVSFTDSSENKCVMSNFKKVKSKITSVDEILNRIPESSTFMGISKGGLLSSNIEADGFNVKISNKIVDKNGLEYYVNLNDKEYNAFMSNIMPKDPRYITQSFAMDFEEKCIYTSQVVTETTPEHILISKISFAGEVLGYMRLHGFGHGSQIGIDRLDGVTKIWCECNGEPHITTGKLFGTKICRFTFENGKEYTTSAGNVFDMVTDARNIQVSVSEQTNRLSVKYITYSNKNAINVYDLKSVIDNNPKMLASFTIPSWLETSISPNQGHSVYGNRVYHYQGGDSSVDESKTRVTVFDFSGRVINSNIILDDIKFSVKEPEGLFVRENNGIYELYAGMSEGAWPNRKYHIYKFSDSLGTNYEKRGVFTHNNGYVCNIEDTLVKTQFDGSQRRKYYLLFTDRVGTNFIVANFKGGKWWVNSEEYSPNINDAVIAELVEESNRVKVFPLVTEIDSVKGADGQNGLPGADATFLELSNEFHSIPTDADGNNGIYSGCETELKLYKGDVLLTDNVSYNIKKSNSITGRLESNKYIVTNISADTGYVDLAATYSDKEYIKRFSVSKNKQGLGGEDGLTPTVYWLMTSASTISKDSRGNLKPSSITFWAKSQTGENNVVNYQGIFKIYESIDGNVFTLKHTSELDDTVPYTPSSTAQSIKCELYLSDGITLIDQDIVNIVKDGTDGFSGADAKYVLLTGEQLFKYTNNFTGTPTPSSITLTGTPFNMSSNNAKWYYKKPSDTNYTLISSNNNKMEFVLNHNDSILFANNNKVVTVKFDIDGYYDEMTIAKISDGSSGSDGEDGYFVLLTNENHTVPCENDGTVVNGELEKAKTEIHVFKGTKEVAFTLSKVDSGCTSVYNAANKTISITSLTSKSATVTLNIRVDNVDFTKVMSISKAIKGDTGAGVNIIGSLNSESDLPNFGNMGDAYIIGGFLYVWSGNTNTWENVGQIKGDQGIAGKPGADGITYYTWVKYADDENGNGISDDPIDSRGLYKKYMGMAYNKETQQESNNPKDYVWIKVVGENGHDSIVANLTNDTHTVPTDSNGNNGNYSGCSTQIELFVGSEKITSGVTYSFSPISGITGSGNTSNGTYTVTNMTIDVGYVDLTARYNNKNFVKRFTISKNKQGQTGASGTNGVDGRPGVDGVTYYTWIKYSNNADGNPMTDDPNSKYIGIAYNKPSIVEGTNPKDYTWTLIKGQDGQDGTDGQDGVPGAPGEDGITYYTWIKYSNNADGSNMTDNPDSKYIGIAYNKLEKTESTNPKDYSWTLIKGEDGDDAYTVNLTNDNFSFTCDSNGNIATAITTTTSVSAFKGVNSIAATIGTLDSVTGLTLSKSGSTITIKANTGTSLAVTGSFNIPISVDGKSFTKVFSWTKVKNGANGINGANGVSVANVDVEYAQNTSSTTAPASGWSTTAPTWVNGKYIWSRTKTTLSTGGTSYTNPVCITGQQGNNGANGVGISSIVEQYYLSTSQTALSGGSWSTTVPTWQQGKYIWTRSVITYTDNTTTTTNGICVSGSKGDKGETGTNGINGTSPVLVTISGQQSMKYLDKTSAPTPSTITLTANVMEGNVVVSSGITYIWQYKNSSGTWVNLSGTYTSKTYSLAHNNTGFVNEVAQVRVAVSYKSKTYYLEHTVTKIYDNKYISKQEVFDKITEGGANQLIYKDPSTGEIYINATFIKSGQLIADIIKGGLLTLGGTGNSDTGDYGRFRILDSTGQNELASMDGGEMRMVNLQAEELNATDLNVKNINCVTYAPAIYEYTKVYVNTTSGNDDVDFESGAIFKTLQGALDAAPKNLNGFTTEIVLQTAVSENIVIRGFSGGTLNILMNSKNINGYVVARDCSAQVFILGGLTTTDIPDGINNTGLRPNIQPSQLFSFGGYNYSFVAIGCPFVYVRSVDIFGKTGTTTNYCGGSVNGSNVYVQNVNAYASNSGWNVTTGGKMTTKETYGRCERLAYNVQLGGVAHICNGNSTGAPSNIYTGNGGQVVQGNVTFVGSGDVGSNNNTTTNNTSIVLNANYGDSYKVKYSSWRKDNSVRQGDWSSTGMNKGCWFFGNQFADLKGKTIKSVKLTLQRQSGGNSSAVAFTLKMHNHTGRPSGAPSYLSGWSKNVSLSLGQSSTITITDSAVLTAIKNGTMKGFGVEISSTSNSYYGILSPKLKAVVTYS